MGGVYALPTIIADYRNDRHLIAIWVLNFFGGWTVVGWAAALIWSLHEIGLNQPERLDILGFG